MNLNKIGKYILVVSAPVFVLSLLSMFFIESMQEAVGGILLLISYILFSVSLSLIFYNSIPLKRKKAIRAISIISGSILQLVGALNLCIGQALQFSSSRQIFYFHSDVYH
jgi:hypothetical protein